MKNAELFDILAGEILENRVFAESKTFIQHGRISVYAHSLDVARLSFKLGELCKVVDLRSLVRAALLHDFFRYDWHVPEKMWSLHGWTHPVTAAENAKAHFNASEKEYSLIRTHMWPWTLLHPPKYKEGWLICLSDKIVSLKETLRLNRKGNSTIV
jgi:uncharacterized protein